MEAAIAADFSSFPRKAALCFSLASYAMNSITTISRLRRLSPLWCLSAPPSPRCIGRAPKGKRLYGQARRLTSPDLHILCRMCTVGLWVLGSGINLSLWQQRRENHTTGLAPVEMHPFCRLSATSLHGKASHTIFRSLRSPCKSCSLATPEGEICSLLNFWSHKHLKA